MLAAFGRSFRQGPEVPGGIGIKRSHTSNGRSVKMIMQPVFEVYQAFLSSYLDLIYFPDPAFHSTQIVFIAGHPPGIAT